MSLKDLYGKKSNQIITQADLEKLEKDVESTDYVAAKVSDNAKFIPRVTVDFDDPKTFARYGSAEKYYEDAVANIVNTYPYDGSAREKLEWYSGSTYIDNWIFENKYPRTTGYVSFNSAAFGGTSTTLGGFNYRTFISPQYVTLKGGPHPTPTNPTGKLAKQFPEAQGKSNILDSSKSRESNLQVDGSVGNTIEFWWKKEAINESGIECLFDLWNRLSSQTNTGYGRILIEHDDDDYYTASNSFFYLSYLQRDVINGWCGIFRQGVGLSTELPSTFDATKWNHYAFSFINSSANSTDIDIKFYLNGNLIKEVTGGFGKQLSTLVLGAGTTASIGSYQYSPDADPTVYSSFPSPNAGVGATRSKFDEFRFWKKARTAEEIGRHWFTQVAGGTNTDDANTDLGVYYKFNEGVVNSSSAISVDAAVLDYSGRLSNGTITNYGTTVRSTDSAIEEYDSSRKEFKDPILYTAHPDIISLLSDFRTEGNLHDVQNNSAIYHTMPDWIISEDENENSGTLKNLTQVIASYFDTLHLQIEALPKLTNSEYTQSGEKPLPFAKKLLESVGFIAPEIFVDSTVLESLVDRNEEILFEDSISNVKNMIYQNIYNNISNIYKSKGTEKSFRNILRCYGVGDELIKINLYGDGVKFKLENNFKSISVKKNYLDYNHINRQQATCFQFTDPNNSDSTSFVAGSSSNQFDHVPFTLEADIIFPKKMPSDHENFTASTVATASLFGMHQADPSDADDLTWYGSDACGFSVQSIKVGGSDSADVKFKLTTTGGWGSTFELESPIFQGTYDNQRWNFAVRLKPDKYPAGLAWDADNGTYTLEFYGVNSVLDIVQNEFSVTQAISNTNGKFALNAAKRVFAGAEYEDYSSASAPVKTDVKVGAIRYWLDYLDDDTIKAHARDVTNYGAKHPSRHAYLQTTAGGLDMTQADTLALNWNFETAAVPHAIVIVPATGSVTITNAAAGLVGDEIEILTTNQTLITAEALANNFSGPTLFNFDNDDVTNSGSGSAGTLVNSTNNITFEASTAGDNGTGFGRAIKMNDGSGTDTGYATFPKPAIGTGECTIEFWMRYGATSGSTRHDGILSANSDVGSTNGFGIKAKYNSGPGHGEIHLLLNGLTFSYAPATFFNYSSYGPWKHIAFTRTISGGNETWELYYDGTKRSLYAWDQSNQFPFSAVDLDIAAGDWRLGALVGSSGEESYFQGYLDGVTIHDSVIYSGSTLTIPTAPYGSVTTTSNTNSPKFGVVISDTNQTATNLASCLNANSLLSASSASGVVTIIQATGGSAGNNAITLSDSTEMSKVDFAGGGTAVNPDSTDSDAYFYIEDVSSGSAAVADDSWLATALKKQHTGKGDFYYHGDTKAVDRNFIFTAKQQLPESISSSDTVSILDQDDITFTKESRPINHFWAIEKSMYQAISDEMINMFSTIVDFNNLIGNPVNRYRMEYKELGKLRQMFFDTVQNDPSIEKYVEFYKWVDSSINSMIQQLIPASANFSDEMRTMVESHVLERNKYWNKPPTLITNSRDKNPLQTPALGINELLYDWDTGFATTDITKNKLWWNDRAERDNSTITSGDPDVDADRNQILHVATTNLTGSWMARTLANRNGTTYEGTAYVLRNLARPYRFTGTKEPTPEDIVSPVSITNVPSPPPDSASLLAQSALPVPATGSVTITSTAAGLIGDTVTVLTTDQTSIVATAHASTTTTGNINTPTFKVATTITADVLYHFNANSSSAPIDATGNTTAVYVGGAGLATSTGDSPSHFPENSSLSWASSSDKVRINYPASLGLDGALTIDFWVKIADVTKTGFVFGGEWAGITYNVPRVGLKWWGSGVYTNRWALTIFDSGSGMSFSTTGISPSNDTWMHIAITRDTSDNWDIYFNGSVVNIGNSHFPAGDATIDWGAATAEANNAVATLSIGSSGTDVNDATIYVDEFRIVKGSRVWTADFSSTFSGNEPGPYNLALIYDTNGTATNLASCLNANSLLSASSASGLVTIVQAQGGSTGNSAITLSDDTYMSKINFVGGTSSNVFVENPTSVINNQLGNYRFPYDVVQTSGRRNNNSWFVQNEGLPSSMLTSSESTTVYGLYDFELPERTPKKHVFVERFSAPGSADTMQRGMLDIEGEEYSVYNNLNFRNLDVRLRLGEWLTKHFEWDTEGETNGGPRENFHKIHRNSKHLFQAGGGLTSNYDNFWIQHPIPQSDHQYSWIAASIQTGSFQELVSGFSTSYANLIQEHPAIETDPSSTSYGQPAIVAEQVDSNIVEMLYRFEDAPLDTWFVSPDSCPGPNNCTPGGSNTPTTLLDSSGNNNHATTVKSLGFVESGAGTAGDSVNFGTALYFFSKSSRVLIPDINLGTDDCTIEFWWQPWSTAANQANLGVPYGGGYGDYDEFNTRGEYVFLGPPSLTSMGQVPDSAANYLNGGMILSWYFDGDYAGTVGENPGFRIKSKTPAGAVTWVYLSTENVADFSYDSRDWWHVAIVRDSGSVRLYMTKAGDEQGNYVSTSADGGGVWFDGSFNQQLADGNYGGTIIGGFGAPYFQSLYGWSAHPWDGYGPQYNLQACALDQLKISKTVAYTGTETYSPAVETNEAAELGFPFLRNFQSWNKERHANSYKFLRKIDKDGETVTDPLCPVYWTGSNIVGDNILVDADWDKYASDVTLNEVLLHRDGPYQHPSWKQIRGSERSAVRKMKRTNTISTLDDNKKLPDGGFGRSDNTVNYVEPAIAWNRPLLYTVQPTGSTVNADLTTTYSNNLEVFANPWLQSRLNIEKRANQMYDMLHKEYTKTGSIRLLNYEYSEYIFPKHHHVTLSRTRDRSTYSEIAGTGSQGYDRRSSQIKTFWRGKPLERQRTLYNADNHYAAALNALGARSRNSSIWALDYFKYTPSGSWCSTDLNSDIELVMRGDLAWAGYSQHRGFIYEGDSIAATAGEHNGGASDKERKSLVAPRPTLQFIHNPNSLLAKEEGWAWKAGELWVNPNTASAHKTNAPWEDTYEKYGEDVRLIGQNYALIPEYKVSNHMEFYINQSAGDFLSDNTNMFDLPGSVDMTSTSSTENFFALQNNPTLATVEYVFEANKADGYNKFSKGYMHNTKYRDISTICIQEPPADIDSADTNWRCTEDYPVALLNGDNISYFIKKYALDGTTSTVTDEYTITKGKDQWMSSAIAPQISASNFKLSLSQNAYGDLEGMPVGCGPISLLSGGNNLWDDKYDWDQWENTFLVSFWVNLDKDAIAAHGDKDIGCISLYSEKKGHSLIPLDVYGLPDEVVTDIYSPFATSTSSYVGNLGKHARRKGLGGGTFPLKQAYEIHGPQSKADETTRALQSVQAFSTLTQETKTPYPKDTIEQANFYLSDSSDTNKRACWVDSLGNKVYFNASLTKAFDTEADGLPALTTGKWNHVSVLYVGGSPTANATPMGYDSRHHRVFLWINNRLIESETPEGAMTTAYTNVHAQHATNGTLHMGAGVAGTRQIKSFGGTLAGNFTFGKCYPSVLPEDRSFSYTMPEAILPGKVTDLAVFQGGEIELMLDPTDPDSFDETQVHAKTILPSKWNWIFDNTKTFESFKTMKSALVTKLYNSQCVDVNTAYGEWRASFLDDPDNPTAVRIAATETHSETPNQQSDTSIQRDPDTAKNCSDLIAYYPMGIPYWKNTAEPKVLSDDFFDCYSYTDDIKFLDKMINDHSEYVPTLKLEVDTVKKLLPYNGFYPSQRAVQLGSLFYDSIAPNIKGMNSATSANDKARAEQAALQPFFAPGILFNTIKSGIAVDWATYKGDYGTVSVDMRDRFLGDYSDKSLNQSAIDSYVTDSLGKANPYGKALVTIAKRAIDIRIGQGLLDESKRDQALLSEMDRAKKSLRNLTRSLQQTTTPGCEERDFQDWAKKNNLEANNPSSVEKFTNEVCPFYQYRQGTIKFISHKYASILSKDQIASLGSSNPKEINSIVGQIIQEVDRIPSVVKSSTLTGNYSEIDLEGSYLDATPNLRIPFEGLINLSGVPNTYSVDEEHKIFYLSPSNYLERFETKTLFEDPEDDNVYNNLRYPYFEWTGKKDVLYELAMHNFLAEIPNFFLKNGELSSFLSATEDDFNTVQDIGKTYYMDVDLYKTEDFDMTVSPHDGSTVKITKGLDSKAVELKDVEENSYTTQGRYYGPAFRCKSNGKLKDDGFYIEDPAQAPHTPPYFYGTAKARLAFKPQKTGKPTLADIQANTTIEYINEELDEKFKSKSTNRGNTDSWKNTPAYKGRMPIDSSISFFGRKNIKDASSWVISTKFECPTLNFNTSENRKTRTYMNAKGKIVSRLNIGENTCVAEDERNVYGAVNRDPRGTGIWSGYGRLPSSSNEGIFMELRESFNFSDLSQEEKEKRKRYVISFGIKNDVKKLHENVIILTSPDGNVETISIGQPDMKISDIRPSEFSSEKQAATWNISKNERLYSKNAKIRTKHTSVLLGDQFENPNPNISNWAGTGTSESYDIQAYFGKEHWLTDFGASPFTPIPDEDTNALPRSYDIANAICYHINYKAKTDPQKFKWRATVKNVLEQFVNESVGLSSASRLTDRKFGLPWDAGAAVEIEWTGPITTESNLPTIEVTPYSISSDVEFRGIHLMEDGSWQQPSASKLGGKVNFYEKYEVDSAKFSPSKIGSLIDLCGFEPNTSRIGDIAGKKKLQEAVVMIPFVSSAIDKNNKDRLAPTVEIDNRNFFKVSDKILSDTKKVVDTIENMTTEGKTRAASYNDSTIANTIRMMREYNMPPIYDYITYDDIDPFVMYMFEFTEELNQQDLSDIWQGLMPRCARKATKETQTIEHDLNRFNFFEGKRLPDPDNEVTWMVFKVKKKANKNYYKITPDSKDDQMFKFNIGTKKEIIPEYSYNWPYDHCSLIEMARVKGGVSLRERPVILDTETGRQPQRRESISVSLPPNIAAALEENE